VRAAASGEPYKDIEFQQKLESAVWKSRDDDEIGLKVSEFVTGVEKHCLPIVAHRYAIRGTGVGETLIPKFKNVEQYWKRMLRAH
jgi:hypothetical protein